MAMSQKLPYLLVLLLSSCSILDIAEDTYPERFPSKGQDIPFELPVSPELRDMKQPLVMPIVAV